MAKLFDGRTDIIFQDPRPIGFNVPKNLRRWVLLPQIAYKVLVPYPTDRRLNVFQETILKLFLSGPKTPEYISEKLLLGTELVEFVIGELEQKCLLNELLAVTEEGKRILNDKSDEYTMKTGYVFFDIVTGTFWDTFLFSEELQPVFAPKGERTRTFEYGNVGNPKRETALVIHSALENFPDPPSNIEILQICIRHERRIKHMLHRGHEHSGEQLRMPPNIEKVKYLGECMPVFAATMLFIPNSLESGQAHWQVCHPFKGGISAKLRAGLEQLKEQAEFRELKGEIRGLSESAYRVTDTERQLRENETEKKAAEYLAGIFGDAIRQHDVLFRQMIDLYGLSSVISELSGNLGKHYDTVQTQLKAYIDALYQLMCSALYELKLGYQEYFRIDYLHNDMHRNAEILGIMANRLGFKDTGDGAVFPRMLDVKKGAVAHIDEGMDLKSLLALHLLAANDIDEHPFHRLGKRVPQFIVFLDDLKNRRNSVNHTVDDSLVYSAVEIMLPRVMYLLTFLFEGLSFRYDRSNRPAITFEDADEAGEPALDQKLFYLSEAVVDNEVGRIVREYPNVRKALIDTQYSLKSRTGNFAVNCSKVLEELFNVWAESAVNPEIVNQLDNDMGKNINFLEQALAPYGLKFGTDELPESFVRINPGKIKATFRNYKKGVLSSKLYVFLYSSLHGNKKVLEELGNQVPDFLLFCAEISDRRGHGNRKIHDGHLREEMAAKLLSIAPKVLTIFHNKP